MLWREIDISQEELGPIRPALDSFTKGEISRITSLFQPLVGSFGRVQVYCQNFRRLPHNMSRIMRESPTLRNVSIHNLSRGTVEVIRPRTSPHSVNVDIDWSTHLISIFKSVDDHFLVSRARKGWYLCDGFYGLIQLLNIFYQELSEIKGPFAVRRGDIFRSTHSMFIVVADAMEQSAWVPTMDIAYILRNVPQLIFNTESWIIRRRKVYQPATQDELRALMDQALSGKNDRYLRKIEDTTGINLVDALTRAITPID